MTTITAAVAQTTVGLSQAWTLAQLGAALTVWLDARQPLSVNGASVAAMPNLGSLGGVWAQSTPAYQAQLSTLNGFRALAGASGNAALVSPVYAMGAADLTMAFVVSTNAVSEFLILTGAWASGYGLGFYNGLGNNGPYSFWQVDDIGLFGNGYSPGSPFAAAHSTVYGDGVPHVIVATAGASGCSITVDGTPLTLRTTFTGAAPAITSFFNLFILAGGSMGEAAIIRTTPSTALRQQIEGALAWKWGLQANLPASHPFSASVPTAGVAAAVATVSASLIASAAPMLDSSVAIAPLAASLVAALGLTRYASASDALACSVAQALSGLTSAVSVAAIEAALGSVALAAVNPAAAAAAADLAASAQTLAPLLAAAAAVSPDIARGVAVLSALIGAAAVTTPDGASGAASLTLKAQGATVEAVAGAAVASLAGLIAQAVAVAPDPASAVERLAAMTAVGAVAAAEAMTGTDALSMTGASQGTATIAAAAAEMLDPAGVAAFVRQFDFSFARIIQGRGSDVTIQGRGSDAIIQGRA